MTESPRPAQAGKYIAIVNQIRELSDDLGASLFGILMELSVTNHGDIYAVCKKFISERGLLLDGGYLGISDRFLPTKEGGYIFEPMDIVLYVNPELLKTGDIVQVFSINAGKIDIYHFRVTSFNLQGAIDLEDLMTGKSFRVGKSSLLGKVAKVVQFETAEWLGLIWQIASRQWMTDTLVRHIKWYEENKSPDSGKRIEELQKRLAAVTRG